MFTLSKDEVLQVTGGAILFSNNQISITGTCSLTLNGYIFNSQGIITNANTKEVFFDIKNGSNVVCVGTTQFTVLPTTNGHIYAMSKCA